MVFKIMPVSRRDIVGVLRCASKRLHLVCPSVDAIVHRRSMSSEKRPVVVCEVIGDKGVMTLNRPEKLNTMNMEMVDLVAETLVEWRERVSMVIVRGEGRAFCAGGDVVALTKNGPARAHEQKEFFKREYRMDYLVGSYGQPYVAIVDGITMGGGVGVSVHGPVRVATERTLFAMPETAIGLFPDVGTSHVLSRLPRRLGQYIGLTGHRLKGVDVVKAGIATHFVNSADVSALYEALLSLKDPRSELDGLLKEKTKDISGETFSLAPHLATIEHCFGAPTVEEILERLQEDGSQFALASLETLRKMSPISMKISHRLVKENRTRALNECLLIDNRLARAAIDARVSTDFYEGVRAVLIDKDGNPKWNPPTLEAVTREMVDRAFGELPPDEEREVKALLDINTGRL